MNTALKAQPRSSRLVRVVRLNFLNPWPYFVTPWIILGILGTATYVLGLTLAKYRADGAVFFRPEYFLIIYLFVIANQTFYHQFPIALSYGVTRRDFYFGSLISVILTSLMFAIGVVVIGFVLGDIAINDPVSASLRALTAFWAFTSIQFLAIALTSLYLRWRAKGLVSFLIGMALIVAAVPFVAARWGSWDSIQALVVTARSSPWSSALAVTLALFIALVGYWLLRRATPNQK